MTTNPLHTILAAAAAIWLAAVLAVATTQREHRFDPAPASLLVPLEQAGLSGR